MVGTAMAFNGTTEVTDAGYVLWRMKLMQVPKYTWPLNLPSGDGRSDWTTG